MAVQLPERPEAETTGSSPARRLAEVQREGLERHFQATDPRVDLLRLPVIGQPMTKAVKSRRFQFAAILPNQTIFWLVILTGLVGANLPDRNFATVITWFVWFCVVFLMMAGVGRAWCLMCPFGGAAEWVQRRSFFRRHPISIGLHKTWPESWSRYGLLPSVGVFVLVTWAEEFFGIAGPGTPIFTSLLVGFIIVLAVGTFLIFDRRTFCRYLCPLTALIGSVGAAGMVAGMRTRDRELCLRCPTKDCMRGSERGYPCPWYEWPGSATSNLMCGLCTECVKNCPYDNVGIYVQKPLTSVVAPVRRRWDVAVVVAVLFGLVIFQQLNALPFYRPLDGGLNSWMHFPGYPNPVDFLVGIAAVAALMAGWVWVLRATLGRPGAAAGRAQQASQRFGAWFTPLAYAFIPLMGVDYLARQLPKFWLSAPRLLASISDPFGFGWNLFGTANLKLADAHILDTQGVIDSQVILIAIGTLGAVYAAYRIVRRDLRGLTCHPRVLTGVTTATMALVGAAVAVLYVAMGAAT